MRKLTTEEYISKAKEKHGDLYDYTKTNYINSTTKVTITCPIHGDWETNARNHISPTAGKCGCPKCSGRGLSTREWVERFNKVHNNKFDYSKFKYTSIFEKSIIICKIHGEFEQNPHNHSQGQQCPECSRNEAFTGNTYYNITLANRYKDKWSEIPCNLYIVKLYSDVEEFYKIGITSQAITRRFRVNDLPYKVEEIRIVELNRYTAVLLESTLHAINIKYSYNPINKFEGYTECFSNIDSILTYLSNIDPESL